MGKNTLDVLLESLGVKSIVSSASTFGNSALLNASLGLALENNSVFVENGGIRQSDFYKNLASQVLGGPTSDEILNSYILEKLSSGEVSQDEIEAINYINLKNQFGSYESLASSLDLNDSNLKHFSDLEERLNSDELFGKKILDFTNNLQLDIGESLTETQIKEGLLFEALVPQMAQNYAKQLINTGRGILYNVVDQFDLAFVNLIKNYLGENDNLLGVIQNSEIFSLTYSLSENSNNTSLGVFYDGKDLIGIDYGNLSYDNIDIISLKKYVESKYVALTSSKVA